MIPTPARAARELPPRPNLGPEPWPESDRGFWPLIVAGLLGMLVIATAVFIRARRRKRRQGRPAPVPGPAPMEPEAPATPRDRLVRAADVIRAALVQRHGPAWAAKTTEEIAAEPAMADWLGPERAAAVNRLLAQADLAKFAARDGTFDASIAPDDLDTWEALASTVREVAATGQAANQ